MSTRTIIEINHDYLHDLKAGGFREDLMPSLLVHLCHGISDADKQLLAAYGIRVLGQRHHSEPEWVRAAQDSKPPRFPTMLRKMWSGSEVQAWIDANWMAAPPPKDLT